MSATVNSRKADHPVAPQFPERWSPRAFTGEAVPESTLLSIFEAARWAPSALNVQPWRFVYARRDTPAWPTLLGLLVPGNQVWAKNAGALVAIFSKTTLVPPGGSQEVPSPYGSFDSGAAWAFLALEATRLGWHTHAMGGFDRERAPAALGVPAGYQVEAVVAIGRKADKATLPEALQAREAPNGRNPVASFAFEGRFRG